MTLPTLVRRILWRIVVDVCLVATFVGFMCWLAGAFVADWWESKRGR